MTVNVGNTQTKLGVFEGEEIRARWRMTTEAHRTADELGASIASFMELRGMSLSDVKALIIASDVPDLSRAYRDLGEGTLGVSFYSVTPDIETGLTNLYDDPNAVGSDRIVNSVAAKELYGSPAIIVDFGTATTVCAVDGDGAYRGGAIMPGVYVSLDALVAHAAKLSSVDLEEKETCAIATNTPDSIRSGFIYGYAGAVDALIRRFKEELAESASGSPRVIATGGPASAIVRHCREIEKLDADLTLKGLRVLYAMNAEG
ncbi:MAG: type III pantothenate kinase [Actinomycetota bacterium]|nr:type III pantothenate kinase [Actinomycetota bacterium]HZY65345.1 type III pantothenate kinase [Rubrobacteraceae bacterium]